jgi:peptidoglycan/LPS O-acetylase OafA/YrhL
LFLESAYSGRVNALNFLRLVFAGLVLISHSFPLGGFGSDPSVGDTSLGGVGVAGFFAISGFLIANSRNRLTFSKFLVRRAFRIIPGYWAVLFIVAFGFGPALAAGASTWNPSSASQYVLHGLPLLVQQSPALNGELVGLPYEAGINGSLWTLAPEFAFYLILGTAFAMKGARKNYWLGLLALLSVSVFGQFLAPNVLFLPDVISLLTYFLAGVVLWQAASRIQLSPWLAGVAAIAVVACLLSGHFRFFGALPAAYLVLYAGFALPDWAKRLGSVNDYSYGLYIYAFPVQQLMARLGVQHFGVLAFAVASAISVAPLAAASWWLVERPAQLLSLRLTRTPAQ